MVENQHYQAKMNFQNHNFSNLPQLFKESDYQEVCDLAVNNLKNNPDIESIYLEGKKWVLGISDLDILVIYNNRIRNKVAGQSPWNLSEKAGYLFVHHYGSYNEDSFKNLHYLIADVANLKLLYGKNIPIHISREELETKDYQFLNAILVFNFLINKLLFFPRYLTNRKIDVRSLLGELYSLTYTLEMMKKITRIDSDFPVKIKQLRNNWFQEKLEDNLNELMFLLKEGIDLTLEVVVKLDDFVKNQFFPADSNIIFKNRKYYIVFDEKWSKEKFLQSFNKSYIAIKKPFSERLVENFKLVLPPHLSYFLMAYADYQGFLSDWIRKGLIHYRKPSGFSVPLGVKKHIVNTNNFVQLSIDNDGLFRVPFPYGLVIGKRTVISRLGEGIILSLRSIKK